MTSERLYRNATALKCNLKERDIHTRREFLTTTASGLGMIGLGAMLSDDGIVSTATAAETAGVNPLAAKMPHFDPKAKAYRASGARSCYSASRGR